MQADHHRRPGVLLLCALFVVMGLPSATADEARDHIWSWAPEGDAGDVGLRLTMDFGAANDCRFLLQTARVAEEGDHASFYGRDDTSIAFHVAAYSQYGWGEAWNHRGDAASDGFKVGDQAYLIQTLEDTHADRETWIFAGFDTAVVDPEAFPSSLDVPEESFRLEIACTEAFTVEAVETASSLFTFGPKDTCGLARQYSVGVCGTAVGVAEQGELHLDGDRNVVRYHQFSFTQDAGRVHVEGPDTEGEMTYASNGFMRAPPGLRVEGSAGRYAYSFSHVGSAPYVVAGYAFPFHVVDDVAPPLAA